MTHANPKPEKKKVKGKWIALVIALLVILGFCTVATSDDEGSDAANDTTTYEVAPAPGVEPQNEPEAEEADVPREFDRALKAAERYLRYSAFSEEGLVSQLEFEDYSTEAARYAVENVDVDWNEQAVKKAESYLEYSSFSPEGLVSQLEFEGFTTEQAQYGVDQAY